MNEVIALEKTAATPAVPGRHAAALQPLGVMDQLQERIRLAESAEGELEKELRDTRRHLATLRQARASLHGLPPHVQAILGAAGVAAEVTADAEEIDIDTVDIPEDGEGSSTSAWTKIKVTAEDILQVMRTNPYATWSAESVADQIPGSSVPQIRRRFRTMERDQVIEPTSRRARFTLSAAPTATRDTTPVQPTTPARSRRNP